MSYQFCLGPSGSGKSTQLHEWVIREAKTALGKLDFTKNFMIVVPDQYTMQTQKDLVRAAGDAGGIMNVDVLSFGRLSHRIFEEVGAGRRTVLDDMGKNLVLRRLVSRYRKDLRVLGRQIDRLGMITEVKSAISEFMQYGIGVEDVGNLASYAAAHGQGGLALRLQDLQTLYAAFLEAGRGRGTEQPGHSAQPERTERSGNSVHPEGAEQSGDPVFAHPFITGEETLDVLAEKIPESRIVKESVIVFDGFTGFTPVQYRVLRALMQNARKVIFALDYREDGGTPLEDVVNGKPFEPQDLFYLTRKTISDITRIASRDGILRDPDWAAEPAGTAVNDETGDRFHSESAGRNVDAVPVRFRGNPSLAHLERNLFRYPVRPYTGDAVRNSSEVSSPTGRSLSVHLAVCSNPEQEVRQMCIRIRKLIRERGYHYRDIGVVTGDLSSYEDAVHTCAERYGLPVYVDTNRAVLQNPLTETIRAALEIGGGDYRYETVFRFFRSGLSGLSADEIDRLENYCLEKGIATRRRWETAFDAEFEPMRERFIEIIRPLETQRKSGRISAAAKAKALYEFLVGIRAGEQMQELAAEYEAAGDTAHAMEYSQVYGSVIHLLDELYELLGDEKMSVKEFGELVEAGFEEIRLGVLPQQVDRILVGDIERTRMPEVKVLFFLGVNDGSIPKGTSKGGLISDLDREFLQESDVLRDSGGELAPTPRQQMYIQRLYLYMNMTRPRDDLYVSYVRTAGDGTSLRPSYLIGILEQLYPSLQTEIPEEQPLSEQLVCAEDAASFLSAGLRDYADGMYLHAVEHPEMHLADRLAEFKTVYGFCAQQGETVSRFRDRSLQSETRMLRDAAFLRYQPAPISKETARRLYGRIIKGSVTRLEAAAQCYLRQYLQYGLHLTERKEYTFEPNDSGTILHESVQQFGQLLREEGIGWKNFTKEQGNALIRRALRESAGTWHDQILYASERTAYQAERLARILERTVDTLQYQLQQGSFLPAALEQSFGEHGEFRYPLEEGGELQLQGRIDRVDLAVTSGKEETGEFCGNTDQWNSMEGRDAGPDVPHRIYIKIVDYKSGNRDLDPKMMKEGIQLQLLLYLCAEEKRLQARYPDVEIVPAAMLYYHFDDPMLGSRDAEKILQEEQISGSDAAGKLELETIRAKLRPKGMVGSEADILAELDRNLIQGGTPSGSSLVIPVKILKKGGIAAGSRVFSREEFREMEQNLQQKVRELADNILKGDIEAHPAVLHQNVTACTWCPFRNACGFDVRIPGYEYREIKD